MLLLCAGKTLSKLRLLSSLSLPLVSLQSIALMAVCAALNTTPDALTEDQRDIVANFKNPAMPSIVSQTDAMIKIASAVPEFAGTPVFWEELGFAEDTRRRIEGAIRRNRAIQDAAVIDQFMRNNGQ